MPNLVILPTAIAYDLVLEDHILSRQGVKRRQRPFTPRAGRDGALRRRAIAAARSSRFGRPIPVDGDRSLVAPRGARPGASGAARGRPALQSAADRARRGGDAAVDHAAGAHRPDRRAARHAARARRQPRCRRAATRRSRRRPSRSRRAASSSWRTDASACASATCCATTRDRFEHLLSPGGPTH